MNGEGLIENEEWEALTEWGGGLHTICYEQVR